MSWAMVGAAAITAGGAVVSSKNNKKAAEAGTTSTQELDPRFAELLYGGEGGNAGIANLLYQQASASTPEGQRYLGQGIDQYLGGWGTDNFMRSQQAAQGLQSSDLTAPGVAAATVGQAYVKAPSQNDLNLAPRFDDFINGPAGANKYLTGGIQKGINQSMNAFGSMQEDSTQNLLENVLPGIRGNAIASGQFGGSRQGIAEGRALSDFAKQQQRTLSQVGQNNTDAAVAAQAGAYDADRSRSLAALQGLSGQQYGVAQQDASLWQQATNANANLWADAQRQNQQSILQTNALNSQNRAAGVGLSSGLLGQAYGMGQSTGNANLDRLGKVGNYLSPFSGLGGSTNTTQPVYNNTASSALGGAAAGLGLWNQFSQANKGSNGGAPSNELF